MIANKTLAIALSAAGTIFAADVASASSFGQPLWGGIAAGLSNNGVVGFSGNMNTKGEAQQRAIAECIVKGGTDCRFLGFFEVCGAVAGSINPPTLAGGKGNNTAIASRAAVRQCLNMGASNCQALATYCNDY